MVLERLAFPEFVGALARDQSASSAQRCIRRTLYSHAGRPIAAPEPLVATSLVGKKPGVRHD